jgi:hypothetical protein
VFASIGNGYLGAVALDHLRGIGLCLTAARATPNDQPDPGLGGVSRVIGGPLYFIVGASQPQRRRGAALTIARKRGDNAVARAPDSIARSMLRRMQRLA